MLSGINTAIYCRLSKDDGSEESQSIQSQKDILIKYVNEQNWNIVEIYIDDGFSGTDYNRPAFRRMIKDIEIGRINIVITKDLSRLGRNYIQTGYYTEEYFPDHNIRYVALNDNFDTSVDGNNDFIPFKNIINEWYAKDISKKIKFTLENQAKAGIQKRTAKPVFGYTFNEKSERIIDNETAPIVRLIFDEYIKQGSATKVAKYLKSNSIKIPSYYNAIKHNYNKDKILSLTDDELITWSKDTIRDILRNNAYLGIYTKQKQKTKSFKNHAIIPNENRVEFIDKFEPIIERDKFDTVQRILSRVRGSDIPMEENKYKGIVYCSCCKSKLRFERKFNNKTKQVVHYRYYCNNKNCNETSNIQVKYLDMIIKNELINLKNIIISKEKDFVNFVNNFNFKTSKIKTDYSKEINNHIKRNEELDMFIQKLFESNALGKVPIATYDLMMDKYIQEKKELEELIKKLSVPQKYTESDKDRATMIVNTLKKINDENILDTSLLRFLIDSIEIKCTEKEGKSRKYNYDIFVNYVSIDLIIKEFVDESSNICTTI